MKKLSILVVDDDRDFAESLADALELVGHDVMLAFSGEEATQILENSDYDITFMDVKLPGKNGVESFFEVRRMKPNARIIMMTGYSVPQLLEQASESGAWDVLHKPLEMQKVLRVIGRVKPCGVLIANSDPEFLCAIRSSLESEGYSVHVATKEGEVLGQLQAKTVDVLILDLRMPLMSGLDTYLKMKEAGNFVPGIIITTDSPPEAENVPMLESLSVYGILKKPFDAEELFKAMDKICAGRSKRD